MSMKMRWRSSSGRVGGFGVGWRKGGDEVVLDGVGDLDLGVEGHGLDAEGEVVGAVALPVVGGADDEPVGVTEGAVPDEQADGDDAGAVLHGDGEGLNDRSRGGAEGSARPATEEHVGDGAAEGHQHGVPAGGGRQGALQREVAQRRRQEVGRQGLRAGGVGGDRP